MVDWEGDGEHVQKRQPSPDLWDAHDAAAHCGVDVDAWLEWNRVGWRNVPSRVATLHQWVPDEVRSRRQRQSTSS
jgi:hypothetical protein